MGGIPAPLSGASTILYLGLVVFSMLINLAGVLVAMDARERGMSKRTAVLWYFAVIMLFGLPAIAYLILRNAESSKSNTAPQRPAKQNTLPQKYCPYCGAPQAAGSKICPACQKFL
jgi:hypothetical protein